MNNRKTMTRIAVVSMLCLILNACGMIQNQSQTAGTSSMEAGEAKDVNSNENTISAKPLEGASIVLKVAHPDNDTSMLEQSWNCYARTFKSSVELYSGGEITCEIHPNNELGDAASCMEQCSAGTLDVCMSLSTGSLAGWVPNISIFDIPYIIEDLDAANIVCEGPIYRSVDKELMDKGNLHILSMFQTGFRNIDTMNQPVKTVGDLAGMKFRIQEVDAQIAMVNAWGAIPTTVSFSELYSAAQTGMIDGFDNSNHILFLNNLYETVKYVTQTEHLANVVVSLISQKTYNRLTENQKRAVDRAAMDAKRATLGVIAANNVNLSSKLQEQGIEIIALTDEQKQEFKEACFQTSKESVLLKVDHEFYKEFTEEYENAEILLGLRQETSRQ